MSEGLNILRDAFSGLGDKVVKYQMLKRADEEINSSRNVAADMSEDVIRFGNAILNDQDSSEKLQRLWGDDWQGVLKKKIGQLSQGVDRRGRRIESAEAYRKRANKFNRALYDAGLDLPMLIQMSATGALDEQTAAAVRSDINNKRKGEAYQNFLANPGNNYQEMFGKVRQMGLDPNAPEVKLMVREMEKRAANEILGSEYESLEEFNQALVDNNQDPRNPVFKDKRTDVVNRSVRNDIDNYTEDVGGVQQSIPEILRTNFVKTSPTGAQAFDVAGAMQYLKSNINAPTKEHETAIQNYLDAQRISILAENNIGAAVKKAAEIGQKRAIQNKTNAKKESLKIIQTQINDLEQAENRLMGQSKSKELSPTQKFELKEAMKFKEQEIKNLIETRKQVAAMPEQSFTQRDFLKEAELTAADSSSVIVDVLNDFPIVGVKGNIFGKNQEKNLLPTAKEQLKEIPGYDAVQNEQGEVLITKDGKPVAIATGEFSEDTLPARRKGEKPQQRFFLRYKTIDEAVEGDPETLTRRTSEFFGTDESAKNQMVEASTTEEVRAIPSGSEFIWNGPEFIKDGQTITKGTVIRKKK